MRLDLSPLDTIEVRHDPYRLSVVVSGASFDAFTQAIRDGDVEKAELKYKLAGVTAALNDSRSEDVDELKAVIVSQAREIARLKGESE
ncbi:hypothetical protein [Streptomyces sp. NPDC059753]|uniref:hypothetical protein n=1 Tax=Streptomyces sp. NPDC059753 TaxID=3346933 RepID=UPI003663296B